MASVTAKRPALRPNRPPNFFWQGLLIVLPVILLAALGFFSLRQDKVLAEHEATERAQALADDLAQAAWAELTSARNPALPAFKVDRFGDLVFPVPVLLAPKPKFLNHARLTPDQQTLGSLAQRVN